MKVLGVSFGLLLLMNIQVLTDPPYWDALTGIFSQAVWLKDYDFDYFQLWQQPKWLDGGPHVQILYLLAPVYALLLKVLPPAGAFAVIHVFNIFCAALAIALFYRVLCDFMTAKLALLWCTAAALDPIWSGQVASLYIEIPQAACYGTAILALHRHRYSMASLACLLAFLIKSSALIFALALFVWFILYSLLDRQTVPDETVSGMEKRRLFLIALPFPVLYLLARYVNQNSQAMSWNWPQSLYATKTLLPFQTLTLAIVALVGLTLIFTLRQRRQIYNDRSLFNVVSFLALLVGGFWVAYHLYPLSLCRYATGIIFPMFILLALLVSRWGSRISAALAGLLIIIGAANQYGYLMPELTGFKARSGEHLERSREYLLDLASNLRICRFLEERHSADPLVVKYPFAHMLTVPEFGYVQRPLPDVYVVGRRPLFMPVKKFTPELRNKTNALYLYAPNVFEYHTQPSLRPEPGSEWVYMDTAVGATAVVYRRAGPENK